MYRLYFVIKFITHEQRDGVIQIQDTVNTFQHGTERARPEQLRANECQRYLFFIALQLLL